MKLYHAHRIFNLELNAAPKPSIYQHKPQSRQNSTCPFCRISGQAMPTPPITVRDKPPMNFGGDHSAHGLQFGQAPRGRRRRPVVDIRGVAAGRRGAHAGGGAGAPRWRRWPDPSNRRAGRIRRLSPARTAPSGCSRGGYRRTPPRSSR